MNIATGLRIKIEDFEFAWCKFNNKRNIQMNFCCINMQSDSVKVSWVTLDIHFSRALAKIIGSI